jgi:Ring finger domain
MIRKRIISSATIDLIVLAILSLQTFCTPNRDKQTSTLTDREMPDCEDRDILYDPEIAQCTEVCAICLEQFLSGDDVCESRNEMCKHRFHTACALEWLSKSQLCPCCRRNYLCQKAGDRDTQVASVEVEQQLEAEGNSSNPGDQDEPIGSDGWIELLVMLDLNG